MENQEQNFKNHGRKAPSTYYTGILLAFITFLLSGIFFCCLKEAWSGYLLPLLLIALSVGIVLIGYYARAFALKAQDRAIRSEENLRHFALTGKLLDKRLSISQIIALRFASDNEFVALSIKAADENLSNKQIKQEIKNWKGDYYRV